MSVPHGAFEMELKSIQKLNWFPSPASLEAERTLNLRAEDLLNAPPRYVGLHRLLLKDWIEEWLRTLFIREVTIGSFHPLVKIFLKIGKAVDELQKQE